MLLYDDITALTSTIMESSGSHQPTLTCAQALQTNRHVSWFECVKPRDTSQQVHATDGHVTWFETVKAPKRFAQRYDTVVSI